MSSNSDRVDIAHRTLRQAIIEQAIKAGTKLPEDEIGRHFSMSRTLVRAVLAKLQAQGLVDTYHKRTATVAQPSLEEARDAFAVRRALEREVMKAVAKRWSPAIEKSLREHVREEEAAHAKGDVRLSTRLAGEFHLKLADLAGNALLERYLSELVSRCSLILAMYSRPHSSECAISEHSGLIAALKKGDIVAAERLMDDHLSSVESRALFEDEPAAEPDLGSILSRFSARAAG
ncbi:MULTISPECIES: GntR family transcriptional regulator [unclassified Rhizobium]|uniref:GntR family transcriptional regulator n=1 Tax=unclassified Rhizobium TaxID=2613769 RepID=UPI001ADA9A29|nr:MULTISPECIES: GntR family transcriptional regulator [unclassified Rhizobium]MBO9126725.1 GntR family transcriptional regulator [Rhizobium sp. 16-488-2b]MBO9177172.1 GntR family transcriptional regulator [Rhizobium sp. 16-488-2a]